MPRTKPTRSSPRLPRNLARLAGLILALAIPATASSMRSRTGPYEVQVLIDGQPARTFIGRGDTWVLGQLGARYTLRVSNRSGRRIEAVVSVDGRDVIDGQPGDVQKRGYLVPAYGSVDIDGWRISQAQAAAFRFSSVEHSYAAQMGSAREVGVIGVAVFEEKRYPPPPLPRRPVAVAPPAEAPYSCCRGDNGYGQLKGEKSASPEMESRNDAAPVDAPPPAAPSSAPRQQPSASSKSPAMADDSMSGGGAGASSGSLGGLSQEEGRAQGMGGLGKKMKERSGLGTEYGEAVDSRIVEVQFERQSAHPQAVIGVRYNDHDGLIAMGIDVDGTREEALRHSADPFPVVDRGYAPPPPGWNR